MKTRLLTVVFAVLIPHSAHAQGGITSSTPEAGAILFDTYVIHAPAYNGVTGELLGLDGQAYYGQLYYGPDEHSIDHMFNSPAPAPPAPFSQGYIQDGALYVDPAIVTPGATAWFEVRAWEATLGPTWEEALVNWSSFGLLGKSDPFATRTSNVGEPAQQLSGLQSFSVWPIPEPDTLSLGLLGLVALLRHRRSSRPGLTDGPTIHAAWNLPP